MGVFYVAADTDMMRGMTHCPLMTHQETLCPMTTLDHISELQSVFFLIIPSSFTLLLTFISGMVVFAVSNIPRIQKIQRLPTYIFFLYIERADRCDRHVLQAFFSRGILHPKLF